MLNKVQIECIEMLIEGIPKVDIAKKLGINRSTIYDWLKLEEFKAEVDRCQQEYLDSALMKLRHIAPLAADKLIELLTKGKYEKTKLSAAIDILDRNLGKATTRVELDSTKDKDSVSKDILDEELKELDT